MVALSIVIPCYNYGRYLKEALDSILSQDFLDYEVILIDDGSTDETPEIGEAYAREFSHFHYIYNPQNKGVFTAAKIGYEAAKGDYLHFFAADDKYLPGFLSKTMELLQNTPNLNLVCSTVGYFKDGSDHIESKPSVNNTRLFSQDELIRQIKETDFYIPGTSCIVKKKLIKQYGGLDPQLENIADWYLYHKIGLCEGVGYIAETLIAMRTHNQAYTTLVKSNKKRRRMTFHHLLHKLLADKETREKFSAAGLLDSIFRDLKWKLYLNPKYACYWRK